MLIYHPAFDAYHCVFRLLQITERLRRIEFAKLRIIDFYYCFPAELASVSLPAGHSAARALAKEARNPYHGPVSVARSFRDMESLQIAATRFLAASQIFKHEKYEVGMIERTEIPLPDNLLAAVLSAEVANDALHRYVLTSFGDIPLLGNNGLKRRTGLMEHRYDPA
jgi:hypothetical protein